jgi:hypothetical protein
VSRRKYLRKLVAFSNNLTPEMGTIARLTQALDHSLTFETLRDELRLFSGSELRELASFQKV